ncbi:MAG: hypothetical protein FWE19_07765 [Oscillospiraceae bacterium]|nr:hypothetical protein [Oscillospiraceae bacterium]
MDKSMSHAFKLFAFPTFFGGMARAIDLGSTLNIYNESANVAAADGKALSSDWHQVGDDIIWAMEQQHEREDTEQIEP